MILAVDVDYRGAEANVAGVTFASWVDEKSTELYTGRMTNVAAYESGQFYRRELPCILKLIRQYLLVPDYIVIDGYVYLDGEKQSGLGKHLYDALDGRCAVIGVAKERFKNISDEYAIYRANSQKALFVTAVGIDATQAKHKIKSMHGEFRIPTLLKMVDQACRAWGK